METWAWLVAYLIGFALLQMVLYRYFQQDDRTSEQPAHGRGDHTGASADTVTDRSADTSSDHARESPSGSESGGVHCRNCGAVNEAEATFTYCQECLEPLN